MKKKYISLPAKLLAIFLCLAIVSVGCTTARKPAPAPYTPYQVTVTPGAQATPTTPVVPNTTAAPSPTPLATLNPPPELERMRTAARDMVSTIQAKNWDRTGDIFRNVQKDWNSYKTKALKSNIAGIQIGSFSSDIARLNQEISAKRQYEASLAANRLMLGTIGLMKLYRSTVPFELGELEYYERSTLLTSQHKDWVFAASACDSAFTVWKNVRIRAAATNEARSRVYADTLIKLGNAVSKQDTKLAVKYCERLLTQTEAMRKDFAR